MFGNLGTILKPSRRILGHLRATLSGFGSVLGRLGVFCKAREARVARGARSEPCAQVFIYIYIYIYTFRALIPQAWEAGRLNVKGPCVRSRTPIYTFRALIPEAWEAWMAGRLGGWGVNVPTGPFGTPIYTFRALIPEA